MTALNWQPRTAATALGDVACDVVVRPGTAAPHERARFVLITHRDGTASLIEWIDELAPIHTTHATPTAAKLYAETRR